MSMNETDTNENEWGATQAWNSASDGRKKYNAPNSVENWWLRSPGSEYNTGFCFVYSTGNADDWGMRPTLVA